MMMQAMIFAAGLGTRLKPITDTMPKALVEVGGMPLLKRVVLKLKDAGFTRVVVNVHHFSQQIKDYLTANQSFGLDVRVSDESERLLDTGGGIRKAADLFDAGSPILIHNVDILSNVDLRKFYVGTDFADARLLVSARETQRYLLFDTDWRLSGWTNTETGEMKSPYEDLNPKDCMPYAFSGIHTISPRIFSQMDAFPEKFGIMDFYLSVCKKLLIKGWVKDDLKLMDAGKADTLKDAGEFLEGL